MSAELSTRLLTAAEAFLALPAEAAEAARAVEVGPAAETVNEYTAALEKVAQFAWRSAMFLFVGLNVGD